MFNFFLLFVSLFTFSSCASLYSGRDLKVVQPDDLKPSDKSVTFRFVSITKHGSVEETYVSSLEYKSKESIEYIRSLKIFSKIEEVPFPYQSVSLKGAAELEKLLTGTIPKVETDYLIDVREVVPFQPHGGGMGMWGGLISFVTLGIVPSWWHNERKYEMIVYRKDKKVTSVNLEENYHAFHSTLFHFVPSSEYSFRKSINEVDKNTLRTMVQRLDLK